ncbi:uncharacterized protein ARMOST_17790 [Armillaria ostoyae]|uniref:Uncharacterized protein n=1 Tax=Armillaria ostoyae TaxID=47428 RepID=A0A284S006_ARMOS|nr:uncharacterized protein ARMOST_17790 [Armillaria ostoyae]
MFKRSNVHGQAQGWRGADVSSPPFIYSDVHLCITSSSILGPWFSFDRALRQYYVSYSDKMDRRPVGVAVAEGILAYSSEDSSFAARPRIDFRRAASARSMMLQREGLGGAQRELRDWLTRGSHRSKVSTTPVYVDPVLHCPMSMPSIDRHDSQRCVLAEYARPTTSTSSDNLLGTAAATFCAETTDHVPASEGGELGSPRMECLGGRFALMKIPDPSLCFDSFLFTKTITIMILPALHSSSTAFSSRRPPPSRFGLPMDQVLRRHDVSSSGEHTQRGLDDREVHDDPPIMQDPPRSARSEHSVFSAHSSLDRHYEAISRSAVGSGIRVRADCLVIKTRSQTVDAFVHPRRTRRG